MIQSGDNMEEIRGAISSNGSANKKKIDTRLDDVINKEEISRVAFELKERLYQAMLKHPVSFLAKAFDIDGYFDTTKMVTQLKSYSKEKIGDQYDATRFKTTALRHIKLDIEYSLRTTHDATLEARLTKAALVLFIYIRNNIQSQTMWCKINTKIMQDFIDIEKGIQPSFPDLTEEKEQQRIKSIEKRKKKFANKHKE